jgi:dipeptidyl aminopeptidase/acylaminoacyl peptidase
MKHRRFKPEELINGVRTVEGFSLSPDGEFVAFARQTEVNTQIFISQIEEFRPVQLTEGPGSNSLPCWSPDGSQIAFIHGVDEGKSDLFATSPTNYEIRRLTELGKGGFCGLSWSPNGNHLAFSSNYEGSFDIYVVQSDGKGMHRLTSGSENDFDPRWSPDGRRLLFYSRLSKGPMGRYEMRLINRDGAGLQAIGPEANRNAWGSWSTDGKIIAFGSNKCGCFRIGLLDLQTNETNWLTGKESNCWTPVWSPDGTRLACQIEKNGSRRITTVKIGTGEMKTVGPRSGLCSDMEFTPDSSALLFTHEGPRNPFDLWHLDLDSGDLRQLTNALPDSIDRKDLVAPEEICYASFDGLEIPALLYKPSAEVNSELPPAVIWLHGGPNYQTYNWWHPRIQLLVSHGYLVLAPDFRGSTGYGEEFKKRSIGDWGGGDLKDVIAGADWL